MLFLPFRFYLSKILTLGKYEKDREVEEKESLVNCSDSSIFEGQELKRQHWDETLQSRYSVKNFKTILMH